MLIELDEGTEHITIRRERPAAPGEKARNPGAKVMTEVVTIEFIPARPPRITVNRDLCE